MPLTEEAFTALRALAQKNAFPLPASCGACGSERLTVSAFVPARVIYEREPCPLCGA